MVYYFLTEKMLSKATLLQCICLILALYSKKYGRILSSSASMAFNGSVGGYLKLPLELHAKVILLLEIGHIVSKPLLLVARLSLVLFLG